MAKLFQLAIIKKEKRSQDKLLQRNTKIINSRKRKNQFSKCFVHVWLILHLLIKIIILKIIIIIRIILLKNQIAESDPIFTIKFSFFHFEIKNLFIIYFELKYQKLKYCIIDIPFYFLKNLKKKAYNLFII